MSGASWIVQKPNDDVATALTDLEPGTQIEDADGRFSVTLLERIPFGHKFALRDLETGAPTHKYGQVIGTATQPIRKGQHVHVHNIGSCRGRGDLAQGGGV